MVSLCRMENKNLNRIKSALLIKKKSNIHGIGIFAGEFIPKGLKFYIIPLKKIFNIPRSRCAHIGDGKYVCDKKVLNYINHSCNPNSLLDISGVQPSSVALRDIQINEEITCNYNLTEIGGKKIICKCKSNNCKGYFLKI